MLNTTHIEQAYTVSHAIHVHELCIHVAMMVLHSSAFIIFFCSHSISKNMVVNNMIR